MSKWHDDENGYVYNENGACMFYLPLPDLRRQIIREHNAHEAMVEALKLADELRDEAHDEYSGELDLFMRQSANKRVHEILEIINVALQLANPEAKEKE
ncbi:MAG: hypothetical protein ABFD89_01495 [Bryobacteraceae bacterium]